MKNPALLRASFSAAAPIIFSFISEKNVGDDNATKAIARSLNQKTGFPIKELESKNIDLKKIADSCSDKKCFVIASGVEQLENLTKVKEQNHTNIFTLFAAHQPPQNLKNHLSKLDMVALPAHALNQEDENLIGKKLLKTIGVAHNLTQEELLKEYEQKKSQKPEDPIPEDPIPEASRYLMVVLGGDAPDSTGKQNFYTPQEAQQLAEFCNSKAEEGYFIIATNGPRTGLHNPQTSEKLNSHRVTILENGEATYDLDEVSKAFCDKIKSPDFKFFDFKFLPKGVDSSYKALLYATSQKEGSLVLMPGESTSMISEACDFLKPQSVIIYKNGAMNQVHYDHVASVRQSNKAGFLNLEPEIFFTANPKNSQKTNQSAAEKIAEKVFLRTQTPNNSPEKPATKSLQQENSNSR